MTASSTVLHLTLANLSHGLAEAGAEGEALLSAFGHLGAIPGVLHLGAVRGTADGSTHSLALFVYLRDRASLEAFGTDGRHIDFLRRSLLGPVTDLVTADVSASVLPPQTYSAAAAFAVGFRAETFDWQVRKLLEGLERPLVVSGGPSLDSLRGGQRYRAGALALWPGDGSAWEAVASEFRRRWRSACQPALSEFALVIGEARPLLVAAAGEERVS